MQIISYHPTVSIVTDHDPCNNLKRFLGNEQAATNLNENLSIIQQTLNHSSLAVTQVYARLMVQPLRRALEDQAGRTLQPAQPAAAPSRERQNKEWPG